MHAEGATEVFFKSAKTIKKIGQNMDFWDIGAFFG